MFIDTFERCIFCNELAIILSSKLVTLGFSKVHINIEMGNLRMNLNRSIQSGCNKLEFNVETASSSKSFKVLSLFLRLAEQTDNERSSSIEVMPNNKITISE